MSPQHELEHDDTADIQRIAMKYREDSNDYAWALKDDPEQAFLMLKTHIEEKLERDLTTLEDDFLWSIF